MTIEQINALDKGERIVDKYGNYYYKYSDNQYRYYMSFPDEPYWDEERLTREDLYEINPDL